LADAKVLLTYHWSSNVTQEVNRKATA